MSAPKAIITGIAGQDGSYLAEYLINKGYKVYGMVRRNSVAEHQQNRVEHLKDILLQYGDLSDTQSIEKLVRDVQPDEVYNLAAQSHVRVSFDVPQYTAQINALGVLNVLEAVRQNAPLAKFYQASSSEMFGNQVEDNGSQNELTRMIPVSPYGSAKLYGYNIVRNYRDSYGLYAANGILFNHESPRRGSNFVTSKIVKNAVLIAKKKLDKLELGNLDAERDWGHARDYVRAMHLILQQDKPDDFVIATGETHSVREFCDLVFTKLGLNYQDYVVQNPKFMRPNELNYLRGDSTKARTTLNWKPKISFDQLVNEMVTFWQVNTHD